MKRELNTIDSTDLKANLTLIDIIVEDLSPTESFVFGYLLRKKDTFDYDFLKTMKEKILNQFYNDSNWKNEDPTPFFEERPNINYNTSKNEKDNKILNEERENGKIKGAYNIKEIEEEVSINGKADKDKIGNKEVLDDMNEKLSQEYIKNMREEEEKEYKKLMELRRQNDEEQMVCSICLQGLMEKDIFLLNNCCDIFHLECIVFYVKNEINDRKNTILCPDSQCKTEINIEELKDVLDQKDKEKYYKYSLQTYVDTHFIDMSWCPTPNCQYAFYKVKEAKNYDFECPLCNQRYCLNCRVFYHRNQTCQEYRISNTRDANDEAFERFVQGQKFKQCPKCQFWVEKNQGCNHMVCRCKFEFCYKCGEGVFGSCLCIEKANPCVHRNNVRKERTKSK